MPTEVPDVPEIDTEDIVPPELPPSEEVDFDEDVDVDVDVDFDQDFVPAGWDNIECPCVFT